MRMRFNSYLLAANAVAMLSLSNPLNASAQDKTEDGVAAHTQTADCSTSSGLLICTECREHLGLKAILTQGNAEWRPGSDALEESKSQLISFFNAGANTVDEKVQACECDGEKCECKGDEEEDDDDDDEAGENEKHDQPKHGSRKHRGIDKRPERKAPPHKGHQPMRHGQPPVRSLPPHSRPAQPHLLPLLGQPMPTPQAHAGGNMEPTPAQLEALELMRNIHKRLQSIEGMMREEKERQSHRPAVTPQPGAPQPGVPNAGAGFHPPVNASPYPAYFAQPQTLYLSSGSPYPGSPYPGSPYPGSPYPGSPYPGLQYPGLQYPGSPYDASPYPAPNQPGPQQHHGPDQPGPQHPSPNQPGPQHPGPQHPGPQHSGPQHSGPQHSGPQHSGPQHSGPQHSGPQHSGPQHSGPQHSGPQHSGPQHPGPQHPGPQHPGPQQPGQKHPGGPSANIPNVWQFIPQFAPGQGNAPHEAPHAQHGGEPNQPRG